jgi:hypothetical protein
MHTFTLTPDLPLVSRHSVGPSSPGRRQLARWTLRALRLVLTVALVMGSALLVWRVLFADAAFGGIWGLFMVYGATVALGIGLAALRAVNALADRLVGGQEPAGARLIAFAVLSREDRARASEDFPTAA